MEIKIQGRTEDQKFKHLEVILTRMYRRVHRTIVGLIPLTPILGYVEEPGTDGFLGRFLIPGDGNLRSVDILAGVKDYDEEGRAKDPEVKVVIKRGSKILSDNIHKESPTAPVAVGLDVEYNDILELYVLGAFSQISYTLIFDFVKDMHMQKEYAIDELESLLEGMPLDSD